MTAEQFTFDEKLHLYRLDGAVLPSVTGILTDCGFISPEFYTEEAKIRGTRVHLLCQFLDENDYDPAQAAKFEVAGYVESWRKLKEKLRIEMVDIERRLYHPLYRFAGTVDRLAYVNGHLSVVDIKTGAHEGWHNFQTGGYELLYMANGSMAGVLRRYGAHLKEDGAMATLIEHPDYNDKNCFLAFLTTSNQRRKHGITNS